VDLLAILNMKTFLGNEISSFRPGGWFTKVLVPYQMSAEKGLFLADWQDETIFPRYEAMESVLWVFSSSGGRYAGLSGNEFWQNSVVVF